MSTQFTGTPGPWYAIDDTQLHEGKVIGTFNIIYQHNYGEGYKKIADAIPYGGENFPTKEEAETNARLIAAAPDMYEAIKKFLTLWDNSHMGRDMINAVGELRESMIAATTSPTTT